MTLGLIFNHFFDKTHFGAFSVFYTNYLLIFGDKKIQTQKWCIREKFRHQKLGVTKGFYLVKIFFLKVPEPGGAAIIFPKSGQNQNPTPL